MTLIYFLINQSNKIIVKTNRVLSLSCVILCREENDLVYTQLGSVSKEITDRLTAQTLYHS